MNSFPQNLVFLHEGEEQLRGKAIELVAASKDLQAHLAIAERAMNLLDVLVRQQVAPDDDGRTIQHLAIRVFNGLACAWKLMSTGYHQKAALIQRDLVETIALVNFFHYFPERIAEWRIAERKALVNEFGPNAVRNALDKQTGLGKSKREAIYRKFSMLAGHASKAGFEMLRPKGGDGAVIGPFMDPTALKALLEEQGTLAIQAGFAFNTFFTDDTPDSCLATRTFMTGAMHYANAYLGMSYSPEAIAEVELMFGETE